MDKHEKLFKNFKSNLEAVGFLDAQQTLIGKFELLIKLKIDNKNSPIFHEFVRSFFCYKQSVEMEIERTLSIIKATSACSNLISKLRYKSLLKKLVKTFKYLCEFHVEFYRVYGISLTQTIENIENDKISKII